MLVLISHTQTFNAHPEASASVNIYLRCAHCVFVHSANACLHTVYVTLLYSSAVAKMCRKQRRFLRGADQTNFIFEPKTIYFHQPTNICQRICCAATYAFAKRENSITTSYRCHLVCMKQAGLDSGRAAATEASVAATVVTQQQQQHWSHLWLQQAQVQRQHSPWICARALLHAALQGDMSRHVTHPALCPDSERRPG